MGSVTPTHRWRLPDPTPPSPDLVAAAVAHGLTARSAALFAGRGLRAPAELAAAIGPAEAGLHDPRLLPDAERFLARIAVARTAGERVLVFGDFDADGLTGLAIMTLGLRRLGLDVAPYVPDRAGEGHGLSAAAITAARAAGRSLLITVDTGTSSTAEVALARSAGIDVLITDHHHVPPALPDAAALVNPHRPDSRYPDDRLAGTGVAFKLVQLLLGELSGDPRAALELSDLATIGTVADVAPIAGENRAIARLGLERLRGQARPGLAALLAAAHLAPERVDLETIAFQIAPRLNAGGRMGEATLAAELLLAAGPEAAAPLAERLEAANLARRELTRTALIAARQAVAALADAAAIVVAADWPVGIIGLVAGRLAEESGRPAVVVATGGSSWRASARAPEGRADLAAVFEACADLLERYGGHPQAAGCEFAPAAFGAFRDRIVSLVAAAAGPTPAAEVEAGPELRLDLAVEAADVDYRLLHDLEPLGPSGPGNPPPLVGVEGLAVVRARAASGGHTSLTLRKGREVLDAIAFERADLAASVAEGDRLDVVARLVSRTFGGYESLQLELRDVGPAGHLAGLRAQAMARREGLERAAAHAPSPVVGAAGASVR
ncbi:MAG TPA: single-stranded-DNA-specific exonuclease RecJ [Candidatus Limnocylindrales bacterium]|nr:single-stranded-DNA-specific exonuclease RecJ [Candidatus Limnocylindrales bacterium]